MTAVRERERTRKQQPVARHHRIIDDCPCGQPHSMPEGTFLFIEAQSPTVTYGNGNCGAWRVPRLWLSLHGWPGEAELAGLGAAHGWERAA